MNGLVPVRILGTDDWLVWGLTADDEQVYLQVEIDPAWMDTPNWSETVDHPFGSKEWAEDWRHVLRHVWRERNRYATAYIVGLCCWQRAEYPLAMPFSVFTARTCEKLRIPYQDRSLYGMR